MSKFIHNISSETKTIRGITIDPLMNYLIPSNLELSWSNDIVINQMILNNELSISLDGVNKISDPISSLNFLKGLISDVNIITQQAQQPFAAKTINGKKLFKRVHGIQQECIIGENIFAFVIPYPLVKMACIELIGATNCDQVDLEVYDTPAGTISGYPNVKLNQFGFKANISKDYYEQKSEFDADLIQGMKIEVHYFARNAGMIGINFILNELK